MAQSTLYVLLHSCGKLFENQDIDSDKMGQDSSKQKGQSNSSSGLNISLGKSGPSSSTVQKHLDMASKTRVLQLRSCGLKKIPDQIAQLAEVLRNLELSQNKLRELPTFLGNFSSLKQLHLSNNAIVELPDELGCIRSLEILNVKGNNLRSLPQTLVACNSLRNVDISSNEFEIFPVVLCHLMELDNLNLSENKITALPDEISNLKASEMNLNKNRLNSLCAASLMKCSRLKILRVEENCLPKSEFTKELLENSTLAIISCSGNMFQDKEFQDLPGYESYQDRFTATRRKM